MNSFIFHRNERCLLHIKYKLHTSLKEGLHVFVKIFPIETCLLSEAAGWCLFLVQYGSIKRFVCMSCTSIKL